MIVLGLDTATALTAVGLLDTDAPSEVRSAEHVPAPGERPGHASEVLVLAHGLLESAGLTFADVDRVAVGLGPGTFTGLRIGVATARALVQSGGAELHGVSTLRALALGAEEDGARDVLAVIDARRGEAFVAGYRDGAEEPAPAALAPKALGALAGPRWLAVGDGAVRFRAELQGAGAVVPPDSSLRHRVSGAAICRLAAGAPRGAPPDTVIPNYLRPPDAVRATERPRRDR